MKNFKRILSVILAQALILSILPCVYAQTDEKSDCTILLSEKFDGTSGESTYGTLSLNAISYSGTPDSDGMAAKINLIGSEGKAMKFVLNAPISDGTVYIGYDYFGEKTGDAQDFYIASPENDETFGNSMGLFFDNGKLRIYPALDRLNWNGFTGGLEAKLEEWHRVDSWLDFDARVAYFYLDGNMVTSTDIGDVLPCFVGWGRSTRSTTEKDGVEYIDNLEIMHIKDHNPKTVIEEAMSVPDHWKSNSRVKISTEALGGTFFDDEAKVSVSVTNLMKDTMAGKLKFKVTNDVGEIVCDEIRDVSINKSESKQEEFVLKLSKFGYYDVLASFENPEYTAQGYQPGVAEYTIVRAKESSVPNLMLGYSAHTTRGQGIAEVHRWNGILSKLGFSIARENLDWIDFQVKTGDPMVLTERQKSVIEAAKENNIRLFTIISGSQGEHSVNFIPESKEELDNFYNFVYEMVKAVQEISPESNYVELFNEYHYQERYANNPKIAVAMQKVGYEAAHAADPDVIVCGGATGRFPLEWMDSVLKEGFGDYIDAFSGHPYSIEAKPEDLTYKNGTSVQQTLAGREMLDKHGYQDKEIILSELSYTAAAMCETEVDQAKYGLRQYIMTAPLVEEYIWYNAINKKDYGSAQSVTEQNFGLLKASANDGDVPYQAKPVALAFGAYNDLLAQGENLGRVETEDEDVYIYKFKTRNNEDVIAVWNWLDEIETVGLNLGTTTAELYDMYGNKTDIVADENGILNIAISGELTYLKGNFDNIELTSSNFKQPYTEFEVCMGETYSIPLDLPIIQGAEVEVIADDNLNITKADFEKLEFTVGFDKPKNSSVKVRIKKQGMILYQYDIVMNYVEPILYKGILKAYNTERYMWEIAISNARKSDISVSFTINEPESLAGKIYNINKIVGGHTRKIRVNIPKKDIRTEKLSISGTINVVSKDGSQTIPVNITEFVGCIKYTEKSPSIDGKIDSGEWDTYLPIRINNGEHAKNMEWSGLSDLSAEVYTMIDDEFMYFGAIVKDDILYDKDTPARVWNNDSIQFAVATERRAGARNSEFGFGFSNGEATLQRYTSQAINNGVVEVKFDEQTAYAVKRNEEKKETVYELKIKLSDIFDIVPDVKTLKSIVFAVCLNDHDGDARGWMEYTDGGIASPKDTSLYMELPVYGN